MEFIIGFGEFTSVQIVQPFGPNAEQKCCETKHRRSVVASVAVLSTAFTFVFGRITVTRPFEVMPC